MFKSKFLLYFIAKRSMQMMTLVYSFVHMFFYSGLGQALLPLQ